MVRERALSITTYTVHAVVITVCLSPRMHRHLVLGSVCMCIHESAPPTAFAICHCWCHAACVLVCLWQVVHLDHTWLP